MLFLPYAHSKVTWEITADIIKFKFEKTADYDSVSMMYIEGEPYPLEWLSNVTKSTHLDQVPFIIYQRDYDHDITRLLGRDNAGNSFVLQYYLKSRPVKAEEIEVWTPPLLSSPGWSLNTANLYSSAVNSNNDLSLISMEINLYQSLSGKVIDFARDYYVQTPSKIEFTIGEIRIPRNSIATLTIGFESDLGTKKWFSEQAFPLDGQNQNIHLDLASAYGYVDSEYTRPFAHFSKLIFRVNLEKADPGKFGIELKDLKWMMGNELILSDIDDNSTIPIKFSLHQNYPNPFNPETTIQIDLPESGFVSVKIYDIKGREVATLVNEKLNFGIHKFNFNATDLPSGTYIYVLRAGEFKSNKKMILIK